MKRLLASMLVLAGQAWATPAFVNGTIKYAGGASSTVIVSFTAASNSNEIMLVGVATDQASTLVSSVSWNGISFTHVSGTPLVGGQYFGVDVWWAALGSPAGALSNLTVTCNNSSSFPTAQLVEYQNVSQSLPVTFVLGTSQNSPLTTSITTVNATSLVLSFLTYLSTGNLSAGPGGFTQRNSVITGNDTNGMIWDSTSPLSVGAHNITYTFGATPFAAQVLVELLPPAGATATPTLTSTPTFTASPTATATPTATPTPWVTFTPNPSITPAQLNMTQFPTKAINCSTEAILRANCDWLSSSGIAALYASYGGIWIVHIDDVWALGTRDGTSSLQANASWPHLLDGGDIAYAHSKGVKLEIYEGIGTKGCLGVSAGALGHEQHDMQQLAPLADFLSGDTCNIGSTNPLDEFKIIGYWWHFYNPNGMFGIWGPLDTNAVQYSWQPPYEYQVGARMWWTPIGDADTNWASNVNQWSNSFLSGAGVPANVPSKGRMQIGSMRLGEGSMNDANNVGIEALYTSARDDKIYFAVNSSSPASVINAFTNTHMAAVECDALGAPGIHLSTPANIEALGNSLSGAYSYENTLLNNTGANTSYTFSFASLTICGMPSSMTNSAANCYDVTDNYSLGINSGSVVVPVSANSAVLVTEDFCYLCTPTPSPTSTPVPQGMMWGH
jgi:hypothetical protein